jgi:extracellular elastinolytic metalloproteinase
MNKTLTLHFLCSFLLMLATATSLYAQNHLQTALKHIEQNRSTYNLTPADLADYVVTDHYTSKKSGVTHVYLKQRYQGIEVEDSYININIDKEGNVLNMGNSFVPNLRARIKGSSSSLGPVQAAESAARALKLKPAKAIQVKEVKQGRKSPAARETELTDGGISLHPIPARLVYHREENGDVRLAWKVEIYSLDAQNYWSTLIDASSGRALKTEDLVVHDHWGTPMETDAHISEHRGATSAVSKTKQPLSGKEFAPLSLEYMAQSASVQSTAATGTYRVYDVPFETPNHGDRNLVSGKENPVASPLGWHNDGLLSYTITKGNNVFAYEDRLGANAGTSPDGGAGLVFDFPLDLTKQPDTYVKAATTNLFYWNNLMHDVFYNYGFDEESGNFQQTNFTGAGAGGDGVMAEAQDGGGTNNANFLTLQDGVPGRMQMYLWTSSSPAELLVVSSPASVAGGYIAIEAAFGKPLDETGVSGNIIMADPTNGCSGTPALPAGSVPVAFKNQGQIAGNIALVDRGDCSFIEKCLNAQVSGATAVIVVNNTDGEPISMGGDETGTLVSIPAIMISKADGDKLKAALANGLAGTLKREGGAPVMKDGDLDNGIIAHEYGHGISIRLTGGPNTQCLSGAEQGGEGWSDFFGLYMTMRAGDVAEMRRGIGTYVLDESTSGNGIRPAPYTTDMSINSYTYNNIQNPEISVPHGVGFIWATMLWEMTWNLIDEYGYDPDIYNGKGGNNIALQLIMDGLKLQPCSPGFVDARDAILLADRINYGGANQCSIWKAFAKRGLGYSASQGSNNDLTDGVEAFDMPPSCEPNFALQLKATPAPVMDGGKLKYTITVTNDTEMAVSGVTITNPIPEGTSYVNNSASDKGRVSGGVLKYSPIRMAAGETVTRTFEVQVYKGGGTDVLFSDDMEKGSINWTSRSVVGLDKWELTSKNPYSGTTSWFAKDPNNLSDQHLILKNPVLVQAGTQLRFWHSYATEDGYDGGKVEITTNGGLTWTDLGSKMTKNGYNGTIPVLNASPVNGAAFTGNSNGYIETIVDLDSYKGQRVQVRFRMGSDVLTGATGWYVDDVDFVVSPVYVSNTAYVTSKLGGDKSSTVETMVIKGSATQAFTITAKAVEDEIAVSFIPEIEEDMNYELQRSTDGLTFESISHTGSAALQRAEKGYLYSDKEVMPGTTYYYRVVQVNATQQSGVASEVVKAMPDAGALKLELYPNPASDRVTIRMANGSESKVAVNLVNMLGQRMGQQEFSAESSASEMEFVLPAVANGVYYLEIYSGDRKVTRKVVISK